MRKSIGHAKATFGRVAGRRALIISAILAIAVIALCVSGARERAAQAASPQATPTPTPGPTPDYSKVDDILSGRRHVLRTDDVVINANLNTDFVQQYTLQTADSKATYFPGNDTLLDTSVLGFVGPKPGRMFNMSSDVSVSAAYRAGSYNIDVIVASGGSTIKDQLPVPLTETIDSVAALELADFTGDGYADGIMSYSTENYYGMTAFSAGDVNGFDPNVGLRFGTEYQDPQNLIDAMTAGDFDGDGRPEIAGISIKGGSVELYIYSVNPQTLEVTQKSHSTLNIPRVKKVSMSAGRFTDEPHDQLALMYFTDDGYYPASNSVKLFAIDFDSSLQAQKGPTLDTRTTPNNENTVIKVQTGRFDWASQYDQLAVMVAWWGEPQQQGRGQNTKWLEVDQVDPKDLSIKRNKLWEFSDQDCGFDFAVGNFDRRTPDGTSGSARDPDLQLALVYGSCGYGDKSVQLYNVDPQNGFALSHPGPNVGLPGAVSSASRIQISAGDTQGRSLVLGEPTKIIIEGTAQPTAVIAAPPMHVDFMVPVNATAQSVLNLSAVPEGFNTFFDFDSSSTTSSSTTHTTSWTFSAQEKVEGSGTFGVPLLDESTVTDTFTAAQKLKGSTENENGSYQKLDVDISQKTGLSDQVSYSETRFNIWVYPVIGQTVCPASKPNCQGSEKVPLTMALSGPEQISNNTIAGSQLEWYQPTWEYGNVLSYPGSYSQLQQIVPDLDKLSSDQTWFTDTSQLTQKTSWSNGSSTSQSSSFKQNYSFENDLSVSSSWGAEGVDAASFSADLDISGSYGLSSLNKSSTDLSQSNGIGISKPGTFADPFNYGYSVTPYIFGHKEANGSIDNVPLTGDIKTSGLLQTAFVVDPLDGNAGGWWKQAYTTAPDVALNHPTRWVVTTPGLTDPVPANCRATGTGSSQMDCVNLAPSSPDNPWLSEFHNMRGFFISNARSPGQGPQLETAKAGDKLTLQARVHNFSLTAMNDGSKVHARFYGQEWNNSNNSSAGDSFLIGEDVLAPIPPFSTDPGADLNYVYAKTNFDTTPYQGKSLVFWVVVWTEKADGTLAPEIANHGLTAIPGALTKLSDVPVETTTITDNTNTTKTVSFSNNVGFYKSAFYVFAPSSA
ncbi:MAG: hypothetical protein ACR2LZ_08290 [Pyrinomonadaceae bacterium]